MPASNKDKLKKLQKRLGLFFLEPTLLRQALTHSSYAYEHPEDSPKDNEVLEFLGDSVLGLIIADYFYHLYPDSSEGDLSKFKSLAASTEFLANLARKIGLNNYLLLGKGEEKSGGRKKKTILAGAFEALIGAIYLDRGFEEVRAFLFRLLHLFFRQKTSWPKLINNYKSALQEYFQKANLPPPRYRTIRETGPNHDKSFLVEVCLEDLPLARATGSSKKEAEQKAAEKALEGLLGKKLQSLLGKNFALEDEN
ncbi:MAG: ribonuclease III [Candidatus Aminicenantes bacterium]|nr:ribonuclease III [Candidatus Aminicenantes bacterium]